MDATDKSISYEKALLAAINKHRWMRWAHIDWTVLSFSRRTAYEHRLHESHTIKDLFEENRSKGVNYLLQKWMSSDNATLQIAAMRMIASDEDRQRLNQQYIDHTSDKKEIKVIINES